MVLYRIKEGIVMKNNVTIVPIVINNRVVKLLVDTKYLKNVLDIAEEEGKEETRLNLVINGNQKLDFDINVGTLRLLIQKSENLNSIPIQLRRYLVDFTNQINFFNKRPLVGRDDEIKKVWFYLSQKCKNNVFLIGDKDVGKTAICYEIARQIEIGKCPIEFYTKRMLLLRPEKILTIKKEWMLEKVVKSILVYLAKNANNVVLYIDKALYMRVSPYLATIINNCIIKYKIPTITTCSEDDFEEFFQKDFRVGKYVNRVYVKKPGIEEILPMVKNHVKKLEAENKISISNEMLKYAIFTASLTNSISAEPGNTINVLDRTFVEAKQNGKTKVDKECILACYDSYLKLYKSMSEEEKKIIAYHEVGHYIVQKMCKHIQNVKIAYVSILPMTDYLGVNVTYIVPGKNMNYTREYFMETISVYLAGRISEKLITNSYSSGAFNDLEAANTIAEDMLTVYGLSESSKNRNFTAYNGYLVKDYLLNEQNKEEINKEISKILEEAYQQAEKVILENRELIDNIVEWLMEEEVLTGEQLEEILEVYKN